MDDSVFAEAAEEESPMSVTVTLNVSRSGRVRRVDFLEAPGELDEDGLDDLRKRIERIRFRPALVAGEPEHVEGFVWEYEVPSTDA